MSPAKAISDVLRLIACSFAALAIAGCAEQSRSKSFWKNASRDPVEMSFPVASATGPGLSRRSAKVASSGRSTVFHDLQQQRYLVNGLDNERPAWRFSEGSDPREFSPNALSYDLR